MSTGISKHLGENEEAARPDLPRGAIVKLASGLWRGGCHLRERSGVKDADDRCANIEWRTAPVRASRFHATRYLGSATVPVTLKSASDLAVASPGCADPMLR